MGYLISMRVEINCKSFIITQVVRNEINQFITRFIFYLCDVFDIMKLNSYN